MNEADRTPVIAYVALGSNIGDRVSFLRRAVQELTQHEQVTMLAVSSLYETEPVGYVDQASFLNQAAAVRTTLSPHELLDVLLDIERGLGRQRDIRWGPRTLDLDLLLYGEDHIDSPDLTLPHPRMDERAFVMIPLAEVMERTEPQRAVAYIRKLATLEGKDGVILWREVL